MSKIKSAKALRDNLLSVIEELDSKKISKEQIERIKLITSTSSKIISELKTEIEYQKITGVIKVIPFLESKEKKITIYPRH